MSSMHKSVDWLIKSKQVILPKSAGITDYAEDDKTGGEGLAGSSGPIDHSKFGWHYPAGSDPSKPGVLPHISPP